MSRDKGAAAERELIRLMKQYGWDRVERTSNGRAQLGQGDFANGPPFHIEAKRCERAEVWQWWNQAVRDADYDSDDMRASPPVVAFRRSRSPWLALLEFEELLRIASRWCC